MHFGYKTTWHAAVGAALTLAAATAARADMTTTISGFGTAGGSFTGDSNYSFRHDASEFTGASNQFDLALESRLGVQAKFDFGSGFSVTAQEVLRQRGDTDFSPGTEWLYAQYSPNSQWQVRLGRVVLGAFQYSDSRQVGFAAPWFRSPVEVYSQLPFNYLDGGQVLWQRALGQFTVGLEASYGSTKGVFQAGGLTITSKSKDIFSSAATVSYGDLLLRVAQTSLNVPTSLPLSATASLNYQLHETFLSAGGQYDNGKAVFIGEWAKTKQNDAPVLNEPLVASAQWYAAAGWRFGKFLPLAIYGHIKEEQGLLYAPSQFGSWTASFRYDVANNIALKAQISRAQAANAQYWVTANAASNAYVNVYSVGVDFVF
ncbi:MAG: hypothetical protein ACJ8R9_18300 [Steroidobacteraceae bacterium]